MLDISVDQEHSVAILKPNGALTKEDFENASKVVDAHIAEHGKLNGLVIHTESFPGWKDFAALTHHPSFIKNHHRAIKKIAVVTDSIIGHFAELIASHFVESHISQFSFDEFENAMDWILEGITL